MVNVTCLARQEHGHEHVLKVTIDVGEAAVSLLLQLKVVAQYYAVYRVGGCHVIQAHKRLERSRGSRRTVPSMLISALVASGTTQTLKVAEGAGCNLSWM